VVDSWVEIPSRPSSSSLSSAATDEIVTTGLRVQHRQGTRKRRRPKVGTRSNVNFQDRGSSVGSSQEEYEESESEEDQLMTSSNENISSRGSQTHISPPISDEPEQVGEEDDDDENATALGISNHESVFTPQPHAFSHPPISQASRSQPVPDSYFPDTLTRSQPQRRVQPQHRASQHSPYNMMSPSHQADHDAALRASLSTLLSCAAAARGLPKQSRSHGDATAQTRRDPGPLRIVSESALLGSDPEALSHSSPSPTAPTAFQEKGKRKAAISPAKVGKDVRATKKPKRVEETIGPTLLTWVVSAGVVVLVSAIGFSAGYAMGKEAGMAEAALIGGESSCGKEAMRGGLRRLRWSSSGAGSVRV
jgi:hypothetical protein